MTDTQASFHTVNSIYCLLYLDLISVTVKVYVLLIFFLDDANGPSYDRSYDFCGLIIYFYM